TDGEKQEETPKGTDGEKQKEMSKETAGKNSGESKNQTLRGGILVLLVLLPSVALPFLILAFAYRIHPGLGLLAESIFCYQMLAARCLEVESKKVYTALKAGDTEGARYAVSMIVGRDTERLDAQGITRAAVETVAENTSDGEIAPLFYMFLFGAVGGFFYKAVNTMDSMIGYKNEKYRTFGTCAARLDDVLNFLPSRLAALLMIFFAFLEKKTAENGRRKAEKNPGENIAEQDLKRAETVGISGRNAFRIWRRDRLKHASPNSAQTESACAGALGVQLAGDAWYFGKPVRKETLGDADREIEYEDILRAHRLMYGTSALMLVLGTAVSTIFVIFLG
ncbi:MAG: adenosylcobinamide-phosphate synthase CbiB, partial [Lachnospiraceae bacterium]|nr:adenosylcobinamide-phosphate synthase CbiB [Lachnospiraceae bacterium]